MPIKRGRQEHNHEGERVRHSKEISRNAAFDLPQSHLSLQDKKVLQKVKDDIAKELDSAAAYVVTIRNAFAAELQKMAANPQSANLDELVRVAEATYIQEGMDNTIKEINGTNEYQKEIFKGKIALAQVAPTNVDPGLGSKIASGLDAVLTEVGSVPKKVEMIEVRVGGIYPKTLSGASFNQENLKSILKVIGDEIKRNLTIAETQKRKYVEKTAPKVQPKQVQSEELPTRKRRPGK